jgi:hypothetical protein
MSRSVYYTLKACILFRVVACDNYVGFQNVLTSYFHKNSFHYFEDYLMTKLIIG